MASKSSNKNGRVQVSAPAIPGDPSADNPLTNPPAKYRKGAELCAIFVHAGAGYHSPNNEIIHLQACNDAAKVGMAILRAGGTAVDAVEMAVKVLEDREITNAGYGSNLTMDGVVECDACIVDHYGRSGGIGAVAQVKNPISLARLLLDHTTKPLSLRRVPPNLLVSQGATEFAYEQAMPILPFDALISPSAHERWARWKVDIKNAENISNKGVYHVHRRSMDEEKVRETMRNNHTQKMLAVQPLTPQSLLSLESSTLQFQSPNLGATAESGSPASQVTPGRVPVSMDYTEQHYCSPSNKTSSIHESSKNAFINSTQKVPTLSSRNISRDSTHTSLSPSTEHESDISDLSEIDESSPTRAWTNSNRWSRKNWQDGSSGDETSEDSSDTLQLPSLSTSPPSGSPLSSPQLVPSSIAAGPSQSDHADAALAGEPSVKSTTGDQAATRDDSITDTVGTIAIDSYGNIACGSSSGGIGMKYRGRIGPAALVGVGSCVIPAQGKDKQQTTVAAVTSGTGEHMATTMAAAVCADRLYHGVRSRGSGFESADDDTAIRCMIDQDFMKHPGVEKSHSSGAIGVLAAKKTRDGIYFYFAHNTDSFALASMHGDETRPACTMSRSRGNGSIAQGGRAIRYKKRKS